jgi:hypothetical protein
VTRNFAGFKVGRLIAVRRGPADLLGVAAGIALSELFNSALFVSASAERAVVGLHGRW